MTDARFVVSGEKAQLPNGRVIVRGTRTSNGGRYKKHVFIEVECNQDEADAVREGISGHPAAAWTHRREHFLSSDFRTGSWPISILELPLWPKWRAPPH